MIEAIHWNALSWLSRWKKAQITFENFKSARHLVEKFDPTVSNKVPMILSQTIIGIKKFFVLNESDLEIVAQNLEIRTVDLTHS